MQIVLSVSISAELNASDESEWFHLRGTAAQVGVLYREERGILPRLMITPTYVKNFSLTRPYV